MALGLRLMAKREATIRERAQGAAVALLLALPAGVQRLLAGRPVRRDGLELDVSSQLLIRLEGLVGGSQVERMSVEEARSHARSRARAVTRRPISMARVAAIEIPGPAVGIRPVRTCRPPLRHDPGCSSTTTVAATSTEI